LPRGHQNEGDDDQENEKALHELGMLSAGPLSPESRRLAG
jgi:hypothetical protein